MSGDRIEPRSRQLAVLGSAGDLATQAQTKLAAELGRAVAHRGLTCVVAGDDGVMGAAASAAKNAGGTTLAILAREKRLHKPEMFDGIVDTGLGWVQFADAMLRSCYGAIVIGGGAGTLGELTIAYISQLPTAFLAAAEDDLAGRFGGRALDARNLATFPICRSPGEALDAVFSSASPTAARQQADDAHFSSYPFGDGSSYIEAAEKYRSAMIATSGELARSVVAAHRQDALGDHFYYHVEDFLRAGSHYTIARRLLGQEPTDRRFALYLEAIALESIAFGLADLRDYRLASEVATASASRYLDGMPGAQADEQAHLLHSAAGLRGDATYYNAMALAREGDTVSARDAVTRARTEYRDALEHHPAWSHGATSDTYERAIGQLDALERDLESGKPRTR
jgi:uncharacterized protein (TIGR00725 family)